MSKSLCKLALNTKTLWKGLRPLCCFEMHPSMTDDNQQSYPSRDETRKDVSMAKERRGSHLDDSKNKKDKDDRVYGERQTSVWILRFVKNGEDLIGINIGTFRVG